MNKSIMTNYWAFLADPTRYHIEKAIHSKEADTWVTRGRKIKAGDKVIVWKSARDDGKRGMVALGEVLTDPEMLTDIGLSLALASIYKWQRQTIVP